MTIRWVALALGLCGTLVGCVTAEGAFRQDGLPAASFAMSCPVEQLTVVRLGEDRWGVSGCGKHATYVYVLRVGYVNDSLTRDDPSPPSPAVPPAADEFVLVPLQAYVWSGSPSLSPSDVPAVIGALNRIFFPAGLQVVMDGPVRTADAPLPSNRFEDVVRALPARDAPILRVFYVPDLVYNGRELEDDLVVNERATLRPVGGPAVVPIARVTGHLVGSVLGLRPSRDPLQLMALGTTGIQFDAAQAAEVRAMARRLPRAMSFPEAVRSGLFPDAVAFIRSNATPSPR